MLNRLGRDILNESAFGARPPSGVGAPSYMCVKRSIPFLLFLGFVFRGMDVEEKEKGVIMPIIYFPLMIHDFATDIYV